MKHLYPLCALTLVGVCTSCNDIDQLYVQENDAKNDYTIGWVKKFGVIDPEQNWNMASLVRASVYPSALGADVTKVDIYSADPRKGGSLIGSASSACILNLDVVVGATNLYVVARNGEKVVSAGTVRIQNRRATINKPLSSRAGEDDLLVEVPENKNMFQWTIACEDLGDSEDFDFNDIVLGINHVATEGTNYVEITPLAAGGILAANLSVIDKQNTTQNLGEIHNLLKPGTPKTTMLNTTKWEGMGNKITVEVGSGWNISTNMGGIAIDVEGQTVQLAAPDKGAAPQMICIAGDWCWPRERQRIEAAYSCFEDWNGNAADITWNGSYTPGKVMVWRKSVTPQPEADYSVKMITSQGYSWAGEWTDPKSKTWDYVPGLVTKAIVKYCEQYPDDDKYAEALASCEAYADKGVDGSGNLKFSTWTGSLDNLASAKVLISLYRIYKDSDQSKANKYKAAATTMYNYLRTEYTRIGQSNGTKSPIAKEYASKNATNNPEYFADDPTLSGSDAEGGFFHKIADYPNQMWLDGLYMGAAFYAEYQATFDPGDNNPPSGIPSVASSYAWDDIADQFRIIHAKTWDSSKHLNYHAWSANPDHIDSFWARTHATTSPNYGCSPEFWGRGIGWYFAALVDVLESMQQSFPDNYASLQNYRDLKDIYLDVASGLKSYQHSSGVWKQLVYYKDTEPVSKCWSSITNGKFGNDGTYSVESGAQSNYLEASSSCMFTYAFLKGLNMGLLNESVYGTVAENAWAGIIDNFISGTETLTISGICESAGLGDIKKYYRDGSTSYYLNGQDAMSVVSNEGKGIGPFIMAALEYEKRHAGD